jgi:Gpi16 subunit, GPI transamidase component
MASQTLRSLLVFLYFFHLACLINCSPGSNGIHTASVSKEEFSEELLLKPLPDRKVLAHFRFTSTSLLQFPMGGITISFPNPSLNWYSSIFSLVIN